MHWKDGLRYKLVGMVLVLVLLVPILTACDDDDDDEETTLASPTDTSTVISSPTPMAFGEPIKIGVISDFSGPTAMVGSYITEAALSVIKLKLEKEGGGILIDGVRRPVEFVKCDMHGRAADATACAIKLVKEEEVSIMTGGGGLSAHGIAVADVTDPVKVPYLSFWFEVLAVERPEPLSSLKAKGLIR